MFWHRGYFFGINRMKKNLTIILILLTAAFWITVLLREKTHSIQKLQFEKIKKDLILEPSENKFIHPTLDSINEVNKKIVSFFCDDLEVKIWENGHRFKLNGKIFYEKPNNFNMGVNSIFGKELELGANDNVFWYWSRRDRNPGLYWSSYEDFNKTRLKTPFNPMFMKSTLGLEIIDYKNASIKENEKDIMITYERLDSMNRPIFFSIFVKKENPSIDGFLVTSKDGANLVECFIERKNNLPVKIHYNWHEENRMMTMYFSNPKVNTNINSSLFVIPQIKPKTNMADE